MYGFTGTYRGERISVQGTGMGAPSISIYVNELIQSYDVRKLNRVGRCGALQEDVKIRVVILDQRSTSNAQQNRMIFNQLAYLRLPYLTLLYQTHNLVM